MGVYAHVGADAQGIQKRASGPQTVVSHPMWGLGTKLGSSAVTPARNWQSHPSCVYPSHCLLEAATAEGLPGPGALTDCMSQVYSYSFHWNYFLNSSKLQT